MNFGLCLSSDLITDLERALLYLCHQEPRKVIVIKEALGSNLQNQILEVIKAAILNLNSQLRPIQKDSATKSVKSVLQVHSMKDQQINRLIDLQGFPSYFSCQHSVDSLIEVDFHWQELLLI